jgi:hypothetical protein
MLKSSPGDYRQRGTRQLFQVSLGTYFCSAVELFRRCNVITNTNIPNQNRGARTVFALQKP